jgi:CubicO group peptidase (beta-lactamase class C family)
MTKLLTTTTLLHLVQHRPDLLTLDTDLRPLVPELGQLPIITGFTPDSDSEKGKGGEPILVENTRPITLRHLLTHTSGLGVDIADPDLIRWSKAVGRKVDLHSCTVEGWTTPLKFAPGDGWYYGSGPDWAGQVLERVTGKKLGEYMQENVLKPLGVKDTGFFVERLLGGGWKEEGRYVPVSERDGETGELREGVVPFPVEPPYESGGGGLYSSLADYGRVMQAVLGALAGEEGGVLDKEVAKEMFRPQLNEKQREWVRGIVWTYGSGAELPVGIAVDFGIGGLLNMEDVEGKRMKGSMMWSGACGSRWVSRSLCRIVGELLLTVCSGSIPRPASVPRCLSMSFPTGTRPCSSCTTSWRGLCMESSSRRGRHQSRVGERVGYCRSYSSCIIDRGSSSLKDRQENAAHAPNLACALQKSTYLSLLPVALDHRLLSPISFSSAVLQGRLYRL